MHDASVFDLICPSNQIGKGNKKDVGEIYSIEEDY